MTELLTFTATVKNTSPNNVVLHTAGGPRTVAVGGTFSGEFTEGELKAMESVYEVTRGTKAKQDNTGDGDNAPKPLTAAQQKKADAAAAAAQVPSVPAVPLPGAGGLPTLPGASS